MCVVLDESSPQREESWGKLSAFCNSEYICWEPVVCEAPIKAHRSQERTQRHSRHRSPSSHSLSLASSQLPPVPRIPRSLSSLQHVPFLFSTPTSRDTLLLICRSSMSNLTSPAIQTRSGHSTIFSTFRTQSTRIVNHFFQAQVCQARHGNNQNVHRQRSE